ncbi:MAG: TIGR00282 family metallophosphoesterase [Candidatus Omnitrophota bacterium]
MKVLLIGDVVGKPGREAIKKIVPDFRKKHGIDFVACNAENIAGGSGITIDTANELLENKIDVITSGDHIWKKKELYKMLDEDNRILRPANYPDECPGRGSTVVNSASGKKVAVVNVLGRVFMKNYTDCPFKTAEREIERLSQDTNIILVDIHAEATSEKIALGRFLDGKASIVYGTHTHVQTADEKILPNKTAYITDIGMTGPMDSVIGRTVNTIVEHFIKSMPAKFEVAAEDVELHGVLAEIDEDSGKAISIKRVRERLLDYL